MDTSWCLVLVLGNTTFFQIFKLFWDFSNIFEIFGLFGDVLTKITFLTKNNIFHENSHFTYFCHPRFQFFSRKIENFVHFQMFITPSIFVVERFWAQFWNPQDPLYRFIRAWKRWFMYKIPLLGETWPWVYFLLFHESSYVQRHMCTIIIRILF